MYTRVFINSAKNTLWVDGYVPALFLTKRLRRTKGLTQTGGFQWCSILYNGTVIWDVLHKLYW